MHMKGIPENMQASTSYEGQVVTTVLDFLIEKMGQLRALEVKDIVIDPGFGFGKTIDQNFELLKNLASFRILEVPILVGLSRKSMIHKLLKIKPEAALNGTTALHFAALENKAKILRVHDVLEAKQTLQLWEKLKEAPEI